MENLSGRRLGEYTLLKKIDSGGNGDVYRAEHRTLRKLACVKVMNGERRHSEEAAQRFLREAQLASKLRHDEVADIYDFGIESEDGLMWIAMELVEGVSLDKWIAAHGPMSLEDAMPLIEDVFAAVSAVHELDIVHRDLKPANVMVVANTGQRSPGKYKAKLIDFGIAKGLPAPLVAEYVPAAFRDNPGDRAATSRFGHPLAGRKEQTGPVPELQPRPVNPHERQLTPPGTGFGTYAYMSPEQSLNAARVSAAADIYSLGVVIIELLTGRRPSDETTPSRLDQQNRQAFPGRGRVSEEIARVLDRALAAKPEKRYASVRDFAADLRGAAHAHPREQLRLLTRQWEVSGRSPDLLARGKKLKELRRSSRSQGFKRGEPQESFILTSLRRARRENWAVGAIVALGIMSILLVRAETRSHDAEQFATASEVERGQQALLDGKSSEAVQHLEQAYQRGERSPGLTFMLARALQPRMSELARLPSSSGRMWSAVFAPDNKRVLTTDDKCAQMWDAASGQLLFTMSHGDTVYAAVFSPDGSEVITAGGDGTVRIWNATTGAPIRELQEQGADAKRWRYTALAMSSSFVAAIDLTGAVTHVWNAETGEQLAKLSTDGPGVYLVAFSADGQWLATSGRDEVRVFDTSTWRRVATIVGPSVSSLSFDPTGPRLAVGSYSGAVSIWELPSGTQLRGLHDAGVAGDAGSAVDAIAFSRDGALVATATRDGIVHVWNAATGTLRIQFHSHNDKIYLVEFSSTGDLVLSAGADGSAVVSNIVTGLTVERLEGPKSRLITAHFDSESHRIVGASWDGTARVWDAASTYRRWGSPPVGTDCNSVDSLVPDQRFIAVSCRSHGTRVWDTVRSELVADLPSVATVEGDYGSALPALTAAGDRIAIARGNVVEVYALPSGQMLRTIAHPAAVNAVAFAASGHDLATGSIDGTLKLTRGEGEPIAMPSSPAGIDALTILVDGRVVVADVGAQLRVIDPDHNMSLMALAAPFRVRVMRPSPDGRRLVAISTVNDQAAPMLLDLEHNRTVGPLQGHVGRVFTARFVGDEILTAGADGTARLWDAESGNPRRTFRGDSHFLVDATRSPDGSLIVAGGSDGFLRFWDAASGRLLWLLQAHRSYVVGVHYERDDLVTRGLAGDVARWSLPPSDMVIGECRTSTCAPVDAGK